MIGAFEAVVIWKYDDITRHSLYDVRQVASSSYKIKEKHGLANPLSGKYHIGFRHSILRAAGIFSIPVAPTVKDIVFSAKVGVRRQYDSFAGKLGNYARCDSLATAKIKSCRNHRHPLDVIQPNAVLNADHLIVIVLLVCPYNDMLAFASNVNMVACPVRRAANGTSAKLVCFAERAENFAVN